MQTAAEILAEAVEIMYDPDLHGKYVVYTPAGGEVAGISAVFIPGKSPVEVHSQRAVQASGTLRVKKADVPVWSRKDTVAIDGVTWHVNEKEGENSVEWWLGIGRDSRPTFRR